MCDQVIVAVDLGRCSMVFHVPVPFNKKGIELLDTWDHYSYAEEQAYREGNGEYRTAELCHCGKCRGCRAWGGKCWDSEQEKYSTPTLYECLRQASESSEFNGVIPW